MIPIACAIPRSGWATSGTRSNLTRCAAVELGPSRIRVNCICPGSVLTPMHHIRGNGEALERELASHQPIGRAGYAGDIAEAVLYFLSDAAAWVTRVSLDVDGGQLSGVWTYTPGSKPPERGFLGPSFTYASGGLTRP
jgi:enoyl-[acyl-carrier-protein] reductase (NADH)